MKKFFSCFAHSVIFVIPLFTNLWQPIAYAQQDPEQPFLGISLQGVDLKVADALNLEEATGVLIRDIALGGAANCAGLKRGDLLIEYADEEIENLEKLIEVASKTKPGQKINATIIRNGEKKQFELILSTKHESWGVKKSQILNIPEIGLTVTELSPKIRERFDVRWGALGLFVTLVNSKMRDLIPLKRGDIIVQVNQQQVWMTDQLLKVYNKARGQKKKSVIVLVERSGDFKFFFLPVKK